MCFTYASEWPLAFTEMNKMIQDVNMNKFIYIYLVILFQTLKLNKGKLKTKETVFVGIEKMRGAFYSIFSGDGIGKQVIKAVNEQTNYP